MTPAVVMVGMGELATSPGGLNRYVADLRQAWRRAGRTIRSVVVDGVITQRLGNDVRVRSDGPLLVRAGRVARATSALWEPGDVVNAHFAPYALALRARLRRAPMIVTFHGPWAAEGRIEGDPKAVEAAKRAVERAVYRTGTRFVTLSKAFAATLEQSYEVPAERVVVVRPGVDLDRFAPASSAEVAPEPLVLCVRRLRRRMGLELLIDAWAHVARQVPEARLVIAGDGPLRSDLERRIAEHQLERRVRLLGRLSDDGLSSWYRRAWCTVVPSVGLEGFGLVVLESLASGTACIVTDVGGLGEVPAELDPGLIVPSGDAHALAERLVGAFDGSMPLPGRAICRSFAERFGWQAAVERYEALVAEVALDR